MKICKKCGKYALHITSDGKYEEGKNYSLKDGTSLNIRNWDMYRDKELDEKGYISNVHMLTCTEFCDFRDNKKEGWNKMQIGCKYFLTEREKDTNGRYASFSWNTGRYYLYVLPYYFEFINMYNINTDSSSVGCYGIRPVIELTQGVYIKSGLGIEEDPYILGKD
ncbi:MAG: hypothetical protein HFJ59_02920 [Clostridia bacterium]|nr:hypothetical protein [Clostridia bacterium]